jgi:hypothetical protein
MAFNVNEFRTSLVRDGARPNLFQVAVNVPIFSTGTIPSQGAAASSSITFLAKAAQLPGSTVGTIPMYYFGRELKFVGNRTFPDWTVTIINDEDFITRNAMETWMNAMNSHVGNLRSAAAYSPSQYSRDARVSQFGKDGSVINQYSFAGLFPVDISPIDLDWGTNDSIEEYTVTFAYQYWTNVSSTDSDSNVGVPNS